MRELKAIVLFNMQSSEGAAAPKDQLIEVPVRELLDKAEKQLLKFVEQDCQATFETLDRIYTRAKNDILLARQRRETPS